MIRMKINSPGAVRIHLTNVAGAGASQLLQSLLPALEADRGHAITDVFLPNRGLLSTYEVSSGTARAKIYRRYLPNAVSRLLECTVFANRFDGETPLLILGDLPLRSRSPQTVFVQTSHLLKPTSYRWSLEGFKFAMLRAVFRLNLEYARSYIVQTPLMREALISSYPALAGRVHVIPQPVPEWLLETRLRRCCRAAGSTDKLRLIYPAASYPHKNHKLLAGIDVNSIGGWPIASVQLTIDPQLNPAPHIPWVCCSGFLSAPEMIEMYKKTDCLLFLSSDESYGFPLVEAMFVGIPIICPNLPYAKVLCGDNAIYFDHADIDSLKEAVMTLHRRLGEGWWPDWSEQLEAIPLDWASTAHQMLAVVDAKKANVLPN